MVAVSPRVSRAVVWARMGVVGLWLLVLAGPVLGAAALVTREASPVSQPESPAKESKAPWQGAEFVVGEFGVRFVSAWLAASAEGDGEGLEQFVSVVPGLPDSPVVRRVGDLRVADAVELQQGLWRVTVSGEVELAVAGSGSQWWGPVTKFWRVGVRTEQSDRQRGSDSASLGVVATSLPAEVAPPRRAGDVESVFGAAVDGAPGALGEAVGGFLSLYVQGDEDLERYTTPGADLAGLPDAGVTQVEVLAMAAATQKGQPVDLEELDAAGPPKNGDRVQVLATVLPRTGAGELPLQQYVLVVTARAGRWEVAGLEPAVRPQPGEQAQDGKGSSGDRKAGER